MSAGVCRICGQPGDGQSFDVWVRDTFTNWGDLRPGDIICAACAFWFEQKSVELQTRLGKDKPQKMQNYSHFVIGGQWTPLSKADKTRMTALLLDGPFPELAVERALGFGQLTILRRGWPDLYNRFVAAHPEAAHYA